MASGGSLIPGAEEAFLRIITSARRSELHLIQPHYLHGASLIIGDFRILGYSKPEEPISCSESPIGGTITYFHDWVYATRAIFQWLKEIRGPEADQTDVNTDELLRVFEEDSDVAGSAFFDADDLGGTGSPSGYPAYGYLVKIR
ncbi:hypothetical protein PAAG_00859 [Paracoccidioides lutzii Pb01]|uniref:Uncharacterized protein n=1 Tax=Paracoccidioides lutzii (strain ATCC MYA-826 / Pb01) TaxID=502779 RepID=C1GQR4_PARBA|nr:hypothetical protein PAAG_00859 [Paracoccidioides lutzii Pb01]EEH37938.2 hypothetical protein PAAG_00859 [Paracoccidioides lutzii Pb01]